MWTSAKHKMPPNRVILNEVKDLVPLNLIR